jgi:uncharacterized protein (DUF1778 family)
MASRSTRSQKLDLRISPEAKDALVRAAALSRRSLSDFVLESALARADETLADRRSFVLSEDEWEAFVTALDAPPADNLALKRLLARPDIFARS